MTSGGLQFPGLRFSKFDLEDTKQFNQFELEANLSDVETSHLCGHTPGGGELSSICCQQLWEARQAESGGGRELV